MLCITCTPDVHFESVTLFGEYFRRDIVGRPAERLLALIFAGDLGGQAEITDLHVHFVVQKNVPKLKNIFQISLYKNGKLFIERSYLSRSGYTKFLIPRVGDIYQLYYLAQ